MPIPWDAVWQQLAAPIAVLDLTGRHLDVNPAMCRMLGYDKESLLSLLPAEVTHPDDEKLGGETIEQLLREGSDSLAVEKRLIRSDGTAIPVLVSSSVIRDSTGEAKFVVSQLYDISERRESERLWSRTLANAPIGMALMDLDGAWTEVNERLCDLVGYEAEDLCRMRFTELMGEEDQGRAKETLARLRAGERSSATLEVLYRHRRGQPFWMLIRLSTVPDADDRPAFLVGQYEMIGGHVRMSEERLTQLTRMAMHDPLTGVANRVLLLDRFEHELAEIAEEGGVLAVLLIDLDELKPVNDRYGHSTGDQLLKEVAQQLQCAVRSSDTVARIGGDEFVVLTKVANRADAEQLRSRLAEQLNTEVEIQSRPFRMSASVGLAASSSTSVSAEELIHLADQDMYARKPSAR